MKHIFFLIIVAMFSLSGAAQEYEFGEVSIEELEQVADDVFPEADAAVLYRREETNIGHHRELYQRIKIYKEEGYSHGTFIIPTGAYDIQGVTYNLVNGAIEETKIDKDQVFEEELVKDVVIQKITFPKLSPGAVIELSYKRDRGTMNDVFLQLGIPVKKIHAEITNNSSGNIKIIQNPRAYIALDRNDTGRTVSISATDIPALEDENYVYDLDLFRAKMIMELVGFKERLRLGTWKEIAKQLFEIDDFGRQVLPKGVYRKEIEKAIDGVSDPLQKARNIYNYVKAHVEWNKDMTYFPENGTRETFNKQIGNIADINLMYISMLNSIGIPTHPVLTSTKSNGVPLSAAPEAFNYLIAGFRVNGKLYLVDAANTKSTFDRLPYYVLNWQGALIKKDGQVTWVDLTRPTFSDVNTMVSLTLDEDLMLSGEANVQNTGYFAISKKLALKDASDTSIQNLNNYNYAGFIPGDLEISENENEEQIRYTFDFEIENAVDEIGPKLYLSPLFFLAMQKNPFIKENRTFPIDFDYPQRIRNIVSVQIPEGYRVEFLPEPVKMALPQNIGSFVYNVSENNGVLQIMTKFQINTFVLPAESYFDVKEFYKTRMEKEKEKIVLIKK